MEKSVKTVNDTISDTSKSNLVAINTPNKSATPEAQAKTAVPDTQPEKIKKRTIGNKIYDFGVFGSIAFIGVSAMSALTAHEAMYGNKPYFNWLRTMNKNVSEKLTSFLSKSVMKNFSEDTIKGTAKNMTMVFSLGMGGHTLMAPIKWLEDHRQSNAAKIDKMLGTTPPDPETIAKEPKQSWKSVFSGRLLSWGMCFAAIAAVGPKIIGKTNDYFGKQGVAAWMKFRPQSNEASVKKWSDLIVFDLIGTAITASVTYAFSRFIAKKNDKKFDNVEDSLYQLNPIAPNPFGEAEQPDKNTTNFARNVKSGCKITAEPRGTFIEKIQIDNNSGHARV